MFLSTAAAMTAMVLFTAATIRAGLGDIHTFRIPNQINLVMLVGYVILAPLSGLGLHDIAIASTAAACLFVITFLCFACGWIGGGDAKFVTVVALWLGAQNVLPFLLYTALFGGVLTVAILLFRLIPLPEDLAHRSWVVSLHAPEIGVPYGLAIAAAGLILLPESHWFAIVA